MREKLPAFVRAKREVLGVAIESLASQVGCSPTELKGFEMGLISIRANVLYEIVKLLGISQYEINEILGEAAFARLMKEAESERRKRV